MAFLVWIKTLKLTHQNEKTTFAVAFGCSSLSTDCHPTVYPGSMQSTTTTTIDISRTIETEVYGGDYNSWSGSNVTPSADIAGDSTTFSVTTAGDPWSLEITTRDAGVVETIDIKKPSIPPLLLPRSLSSRKLLHTQKIQGTKYIIASRSCNGKRYESSCAIPE